MAEIMTLEGLLDDLGAVRKRGKLPKATRNKKKPVVVRWKKRITPRGKKVKEKPTAQRVQQFYEAAKGNIVESGAYSTKHAAEQASAVLKIADGEERKASYRLAALTNIAAEAETLKNKVRRSPKGIKRLKLYKRLKDVENLGRKFIANQNIARLNAIKHEASAELLKEAAGEKDDEKRVELMAMANLAREAPIPLKVPAVKKARIPGVVSIRGLLTGKLYFGKGGMDRQRPAGAAMRAEEAPPPRGMVDVSEEKSWRGKKRRRRPQYVVTAAQSMMAGFEGAALAAGGQSMEMLLGEFGNYGAFFEGEIWDTVVDSAGKIGAAAGGKLAKFAANKIKDKVTGAFKKGKKNADRKESSNLRKVKEGAQKSRYGTYGRIGPLIKKKAKVPTAAQIEKEAAEQAPPPVTEEGYSKYLLPGLVVAGGATIVGLTVFAGKKKKEEAPA